VTININNQLKFKKIAFFTGFIFFLIGCSTEKNTAINRFYHNLTSHYNAFFNGRDQYKVAIKNFEKTYEDDYTKILPVFKYTNEQTASSVIGAMDITIEKATKVIKFHSITSKPKRKGGHLSKNQKAFYKKNEFNNWVDDSWLLIGKAKFYKVDYMGAYQAFQYIISEYNYDKIRFESGLWKAKAEIEMKQYDDALASLQLIEGEKDFPKKLKCDLYATYADLYLRQKQYNDAVNMLNKALKYKPKKNKRVRYQFILAQIYEQLQRYENATNLYAIVAKSNPPYEMAFASMINRATSYIGKTGDPRPIIKQLNKMLKDDKNTDYQDQIYYALASVYLKTNNDELAIKNLKLSAEHSGNNMQQKAKTYLLIADIYFNKKEYALSQPYYDSTMMYLSQDYPEYAQLKVKTDNLSDLVKNINTITLQDSLLKLASLSDKERMDIINKIIKEVRKKKEEKRQAEIEQQQFHYQNNNPQDLKYQQSLQQGQGGKWYFYNPAMLSMGQAEFKQKWGSRKLSDNWRRKNRTIVNFDTETDEGGTETDSTGQVVKIDDENPKYYLRKIPLTDSMQVASNNMIQEALYNLGILYRQRFNDYPESIKSFEKLTTRFPDADNKLSAYYNLYQLFKLQNNQEKSELYKNKILTEFPDSETAKAISDPNYSKKKETEKNNIENLYIQSYQLFSKGDTHGATQTINEYETLDNSFLRSKFLLLRALNQGKDRDFNSMKQSFTQITKEFPNSPEDSIAKFYLTYLQDNDSLLQQLQQISDSNLIASNENTNNIQTQPIPTDSIQSQQTTEESEAQKEAEELKIFKPSLEDEIQFYVIAVHNIPEVLNKVKFNIVNFNVDHFPMFDFEVKTFLLNTDIQLITIKSLKNKTQALKYFKAVLSYKVFDEVDQSEYQHFLISNTNYPVFYNDKNVTKYLKYFNKYYLSN